MTIYYNRQRTNLINDYLGVSTVAGIGWAAIDTLGALGKENLPKLQVCIVQQGLPRKVDNYILNE